MDRRELLRAIAALTGAAFVGADHAFAAAADTQVYTPAQVNSAENPAPLSGYDLQFLAQGDSWFSIGALPPSLRNDLLFEGWPDDDCSVECAQEPKSLDLGERY